MTKSNVLLPLFIISTMILSACTKQEETPKAEAAPAAEAETPWVGREQTQGIVLLRGLPTLETKHSIALVELDPESDAFGKLIQDFEYEGFAEPLHHLYYSPNGRLYATGLDPECSLAEIGLSRDASGGPVIDGMDCLDTGGQVVGEDIMWHSVDGTEYMFVTFMGGTGVDQPDGGSLGVFDAQTNKVLKIIEARKSQVEEGAPYIMYPHGISAYGEKMVVSSTVHPDLATGVGSTVTVIDLPTWTPEHTISIQKDSPVGFPSSPVEVLFVRPDIVPDVQPAVLVNTMFGFETWRILYNEKDGSFGEPEQLYSGMENGTGVPLEFYGTEDELFISHALPGIVKRYHIDQLPDLVSSGPDIVADAGAHHMIFYPSGSGRELIAVQNNLLNLGNAEDKDPTDVDFIARLNAHTVTVHDLASGERLASINFKEQYNKGIANIEALFGSGFVHHH